MKKDITITEALKKELYEYGIGKLTIPNAVSGNWYRIAIGRANPGTSSFILNLGNSYNYQQPLTQVLSISFSAFIEPFCKEITKTGKIIDKVRLYKKNSSSDTSPTYIDIHVSFSGRNYIYVAMCAGIGVQLLDNNNVEDIEGYEYTEFNIE